MRESPRMLHACGALKTGDTDLAVERLYVEASRFGYASAGSRRHDEALAVPGQVDGGLSIDEFQADHFAMVHLSSNAGPRVERNQNTAGTPDFLPLAGGGTVVRPPLRDCWPGPEGWVHRGNGRYGRSTHRRAHECTTARLHGASCMAACGGDPRIGTQQFPCRRLHRSPEPPGFVERFLIGRAALQPALKSLRIPCIDFARGEQAHPGPRFLLEHVIGDGMLVDGFLHDIESSHHDDTRWIESASGAQLRRGLRFTSKDE